MIMNPKSWIKEALAKEADNVPIITSEFGGLPFKVVEECKRVDFMTKPDEIPIVIRDESELHIFALCKLSQKLQILSKMKPSTETLEELHLRCHEYKFDLREDIVDATLDDTSKPGIDYKIVIILIEMGEIGADDPFTTGQDNTQIDKLWYFKSLKCRKFASVIKNKLLNPVAVEHRVSPQALIAGDSDESGESQKYIPHFLSESQEPPWIDSSTVAFSQSSEDMPSRVLHRKSVSEKRDEGPSCSSTKTSADMESCRLQESVNPSTWDSQKYVPQIFSESQEPPWIDSSTEAFSQSSEDMPLRVLHRKSVSEKRDDGLSCSRTKTSADMESCRLQESVNPSTWDSQKYVPQIFSESQEPPWIDSSTEAFSQSSEDMPLRVLHRKSVSEKRDDGLSCSRTKTGADMESCRLQESVNPSTWDSQKYVPQIFSESQEPPWIDSSTEAFSQSSKDIPSWFLHKKSASEKQDDGPSCSSTKTSADMESCRLQELVNPSALNVDLNSNIVFVPSPRNHSTPEKAMDTEKLSGVVHSSLPCIDAMQEATKPARELPNQETDLAVIAKAGVSLMMATNLDESFSRVLNSILIENQLILDEQVSLDNLDTRNTLSDQAADINPENGATILEKAVMKAGDDMNTNLGVAGSSRDILEQQNLADHTCHVINRSLINVGLTNHVKSSDVTHYQSLEGTLKTEMLDHPLDQSQDENALNQALCLRPRDQPSGRHRLDQSSIKRKKRISKKIHGTLMYPIPTSRYNKLFEKYRCTKTFFIVSDSDSEHRQNKLYAINPIISHEFRHGLLQQFKPSSSDRDPGKTTREVVSHTGIQTPELSVTSPNQNKHIPSKHTPIDVKISLDFKRRILKLIDRNL